MNSNWLKSSTRSGWLAGAIGGAALMLTVISMNFTPAAHSAVTPSAVGGASFADVVENVSPAVVNITVDKVTEALPTAAFPDFDSRDGRGDMQGRQFRSPFDEFFGRFFDAPQQQTPERRVEGQGSGFLIEQNGYIVTNNHVIDGADKIVVTMQDGRKLDATLVGRDAKTDLALIKVDGTSLPHVTFGDSDHARVGDWVVAIGNPFGLGGTATAGIISARGRDIQSGPYDDYLQLDAPINFGNSGGPVFNVAGEVVGVNTAIYSPNGGSIGIGFAIPANQAKAVVAELKDSGSVERGWLGVQIQNLDPELATSLGLDHEKGALVAEVVGDGPAKHAGVLAGDVITRFNDHEIDSARTLSRVVADSNPNESARVSVWRNGKTHELRVKIGEASKAEQVAQATPAASGGATLGLTLRPLTDEDKAQLGLPVGVDGALVADVQAGSPAAEKGIRPGDVITQVNQKDVSSAADAVAALKEVKTQSSHALLLVRRGDAQRFVALSFS
jgi:serine protease Do